MWYGLSFQSINCGQMIDLRVKTFGWEGSDSGYGMLFVEIEQLAKKCTNV